MLESKTLKKTGLTFLWYSVMTFLLRCVETYGSDHESETPYCAASRLWRIIEREIWFKSLVLLYNVNLIISR